MAGEITSAVIPDPNLIPPEKIEEQNQAALKKSEENDKQNAQGDPRDAKIAELEARLAELAKPPEKKPEEETPAPPEIQLLTTQELEGYADEFKQSGKLSEDSYKSLEKRGVSREVVDQHLNGLKLQAQQELQDIYAPAGGEEGYRKLLTWASTHLDANSKAEYNRVMENIPDKATAVAMVQKLQRSYDKFMGTPPKAPLHGGQSGVATEGFKSMKEMAEAMKDSRYSGPFKDGAYVKWVEDKVKHMK
jgi:hypothetical protein